MDMVMSRKMDHGALIPNNIFYGPHMQSLLAAITDVISWHNDIYSFYKEVILTGEKLNLLAILCAYYNCSSYTEAGVIAVKLVQDSITEMELAYEKLKAAASIEYHPAIDIYMDLIRKILPGVHEWYFLSKRYYITPANVSVHSQQTVLSQL
ncbi:hypothetical protein Mapa_014252 [Marchantia paleacea]|nr:hypothetical protein Mapa_014252 [Marchantia paleacea]